MRKKILIVGQLPPPYHGTSVALRYILDSDYINSRYEVLTINTSRSGISEDSDIGRISLNKGLKDLKCFFNLLLRLLTKRIGLVYITIAQTKLGYIRDGLFILLSKLFGKKCVAHLHGGSFRLLYENSPKWYKRFVETSIGKLDSVIVLSPSLKYIFDGLFDDSKIKVVENCIDDQFFPTEREVRDKLASIELRGKAGSCNSFRVLFLSNLLKSKGYIDVLQAAVVMKKERIPIEFIFAGTWPSSDEEEFALEFVERHKLNDVVKFLGFVSGEKKRSVLLESDIFILPTYYHYEGVPISILEAMAMGLPIITTRHRGIPGIVEEGANGFFIEPGDSEKIAECVIGFFHNPDLQLRMAKSNIEKARARFTKEHYERSLIKVFDEVLES